MRVYFEDPFPGSESGSEDWKSALPAYNAADAGRTGGRNGSAILCGRDDQKPGRELNAPAVGDGLMVPLVEVL